MKCWGENWAFVQHARSLCREVPVPASTSWVLQTDRGNRQEGSDKINSFNNSTIFHARKRVLI